MFKTFLAKNKIKKHLEFAQKGDIWRLFVNQKCILAGETRDTEKKRMYLFSLDYVTGKKYIENYPCGDEWWESILNVDDEHIYVGKYKKPDLPDLSGIKTVDIRSGRVKWFNDEMNFIFSSSGTVFAHGQRYGVKKYYKIDSATGDISGEIGLTGLHELKLSAEKDNYGGFHYANSLAKNSGDKYSENYLTGLAKKVNIKGNVEFIRFNEYLVYNYYSELGADTRDIGGTKLENTLEILSTAGNKVVFKEILNKDAHNFVPDSFFIKDGYLFFVKERKKLISVDLN